MEKNRQDWIETYQNQIRFFFHSWLSDLTWAMGRPSRNYVTALTAFIDSIDFS